MARTRSRALRGLAAALAACAAVDSAGCAATGEIGGQPSALSLASLTVAPGTSDRPYARAAFGPAWADVDRNGCDTRDDILARDLSQVVFRAGTHDCVVIAGVLADPYAGGRVDFTKSDASRVQIDHRYPLALAWSHGAEQWSASLREQFANDPANLVAVSATTNQAKGDKGPGAWPPRTGCRSPRATPARWRGL